MSELEGTNTEPEVIVVEDWSELDPEDPETAYMLARKRTDELEILKLLAVQQIKDGAVMFGGFFFVGLIASLFAWTHTVPGGLVPFMVLGTLALAYGYYVAIWGLLTAAGRIIKAARIQRMIVQAVEQERKAQEQFGARHG